MLIVAGVVIALMAMNWLPLMLQKDTLRRYDSIEDVKIELNWKGLLVPSYFPNNITWPPREILAQNKPYPAVFFKFNHADSGDVVLTVSQSASPKFSADSVIKIVQVRERVPYTLKGRSSVLEVGLCEKDEPCSRISWKEGIYSMTITMRSPPFELIKIADSMLR